MSEPTLLSSLVQVGAAGAVIAVVIVFLNFIAKRDDQWQRFFQGLSVDSDGLKKSVNDLAAVTAGLVAEVREMRADVNKINNDLEKHDERVGGIVEKLETIKPAMRRKS